MNAKKFLNVRVCLTTTAVALCGALALTASCASDSNNNGGSSGSNGGSSGGGASGGGSSGSCTGGADTVCFATGQAQGAMTGYGWVAMGSLDSISSPTCDTGTPITSTSACTTTTKWSSTDSLCITGSIPALPATPVQSDYDNNWGLQIGVNAKEPSDAIGRSFSKITITVTGTPSTGLRAELHRKGDPDGTTYCANFVSGTSIVVASFNTACWDGSGTALTAADTTNVDKVGVQVSSTSSAITVTNLCLTGVQFTN